MDIHNWKDLSLYPESSTVSDKDAIAQALHNLLSIDEGEFLFNPEFGCSIDPLLFEPIDSITEHKIKFKLIECIERWDPRIRINPGRSTVIGNPDNNSYDIVLILEITTDDREEEFSYSFSLNRLVY